MGALKGHTRRYKDVEGHRERLELEMYEQKMCRNQGVGIRPKIKL